MWECPLASFPKLSYDKLQLSCFEPPSWCVTQSHLARPVGYDISPPLPRGSFFYLLSPKPPWPLKAPSACSSQLRLIELTDTKWILLTQPAGQMNASLTDFESRQCEIVSNTGFYSGCRDAVVYTGNKINTFWNITRRLSTLKPGIELSGSLAQIFPISALHQRWSWLFFWRNNCTCFLAIKQW